MTDTVPWWRTIKPGRPADILVWELVDRNFQVRFLPPKAGAYEVTIARKSRVYWRGVGKTPGLGLCEAFSLMCSDLEEPRRERR